MYYFKQLKSGNYKIADNTDYSIKCCNEQEVYDLWQKCKGYTHKRCSYGGRIIKATYSQSQTYFNNFNELINKLNKTK